MFIEEILKSEFITETEFGAMNGILFCPWPFVVTACLICICPAYLETNSFS